MATPKRNAKAAEIIAPERTFFVTSSAYGRKQLFQSERLAELLISVFLHYRSAGRFKLHEFVVMPNHIHALITLAESMTIEKAVQFIKGGSSFRAKKEFGIQSEIWQAGYSEERAYDLAAYEGFRRYIHHNPVKRGLVEQVEAYPYSSANPRFQLDPVPEYLRG